MVLDSKSKQTSKEITKISSDWIGLTKFWLMASAKVMPLRKKKELMPIKTGESEV